MKIYKISVWTIMFGVTGIAYSQASQQPFTITISASQQTFQADKQIRIHVVLTNVSDHTIVIAKSFAPNDAEEYYAIQVYDNNGNDAHKTEFARSGKKHVTAGSVIIIDLEPGQKVEEDGYLNGIYDLPPGEYKVQLSRPVSYDPKAEIVTSNKITIIVTE